MGNILKKKKILRKVLVKGLILSDAPKYAKSTLFFNEWKYHRNIYIKYFYKWRARLNRFSYKNSFRYKKVSSHTVQYKVKHSAFITLLKRSYYKPFSFGKGHPIKALLATFPSDKEKRAKKRFFNNKRTHEQDVTGKKRRRDGFTSWK